MTDQKQLENAEYFTCLGRLKTNDKRCAHYIKSRIAIAKAAFNKKTVHQKIVLICKEETSKVLYLQYSFVWY
jgi:hypothetical protein